MQVRPGADPPEPDLEDRRGPVVLLHPNGAPGVGKSTLAARYVADHPGVLNCDVDLLRPMVGGWADDFLGTGVIIRPLALAMIGTHLGGGRDVVLPQLVERESELARFRAVAEDLGAVYVHVLLDAGADESADRFRTRPVTDPLLAQVHAVVQAAGGPAAVVAHHTGLAALADRVAGTCRVASPADIDATYDAVLAVVRRVQARCPDSP